MTSSHAIRPPLAGDEERDVPEPKTLESREGRTDFRSNGIPSALKALNKRGRVSAGQVVSVDTSFILGFYTVLLLDADVGQQRQPTKAFVCNECRSMTNNVVRSKGTGRTNSYEAGVRRFFFHLN